MKEKTSELLRIYKNFLEDAIEQAILIHKQTKGRKERAEIREVYEDLVKLDTQRAGFRRYIKL